MIIRNKRAITITLDDETLQRLHVLGENRSATIREAVERMFNDRKVAQEAS